MNRSVALFAAAALCLGACASAFGYSATANVTFTWSSGGDSIGWTSQGVNSFPDPTVDGNNTHVWETPGNNSETFCNSDFAINSDYESGTQDDCLTLLPDYESIVLQKYSCRQNDADNYYAPAYDASPFDDLQVTGVTTTQPGHPYPGNILGAGPGAAASGTLTVTDTTLTGILTVISTTDNPTGATTAFVTVNTGTSPGTTRTSTSAGDGFDGFNMRTADGSPFGNAWYGITTSATLTVKLTGTFTDTAWNIDGGAVTFSDPGFACQQGGNGGDARGTLCTSSKTGGGFQPDGGMLSWGMDVDGVATGATEATPIVMKDQLGNNVLVTWSGVLAQLTLDGAGAISTTYGEFRYGFGLAGGGCFDHIRWGTRPPPETTTGLVCGTLSAGPLDVSGTAIAFVPDPTPDAYDFLDQSNVALSTVIMSNTITVTGINVPTTFAIGGDPSSQCSINGGAYSASCATTVSDNDTVTLRHTSAATSTTAVQTTVNIGGVPDTFTSTTLAPDTQPDPFTLNTVSNVPLSTVELSSAITVSGINAPSPVSVSGDATSQYSVNGAAFTAVAGNVSNGDSVIVRHTSSAAFSTAVNTVLDIGGVTSTFTSTTLAQDTTPDAFAFTDQADVALSTVVTSIAITVSGINSPAPLVVSGDATSEYSINGGAFTAAAGATVGNNDTVAVRHASGAAGDTAVTTTVSIGGVVDDFTTTTVAGALPLRAGSGSSLDVLILALLAGTALSRRRRPRSGQFR